MSDTVNPTRPKVFISYSWTSPTYAERVERLARTLVEDWGLDVLLDQWDLKAGQDKYKFMERSVADDTVKRVLLLIDPRYAERADKREGGVGDETTIITQEVYGRADQRKFIPVIFGLDDEGEVCLPKYIGTRIYYDLTNEETYENVLEEIVRDIYDKPAKPRPIPGRRPRFLDEDVAPLRTGRRLVMFRNAVHNERPLQVGLLQDYLDAVIQEMESYGLLRGNNAAELESEEAKMLDAFLPYRDEYVALLVLLGRYGTRMELYDQLHAFFERLANLRYAPLGQVRWNNQVETEHVAFLTWELFLLTVGHLLRVGQFTGLARLLEPFYIRTDEMSGRMCEPGVLDVGFHLIESARKQRLSTRWKSVAAQLVRERTGDDGFEQVMEADSFLYLRWQLGDQEADAWYPRTMVYSERTGLSGLPLWTRTGGDDTFFSRIAPLLRLKDRADADERLKKLRETDRHLLVNYEGVRITVGTVGMMLGLTKSDW